MIRKVLSIVVGSVLLAIIAVVAMSTGDVRRYVRMRNMSLH